MRSGVNDFRNNRNYLYSERWEEYLDGSLSKRSVLDNGYGTRTLKDEGFKLNLDLL